MVGQNIKGQFDFIQGIKNTTNSFEESALNVALGKEKLKFCERYLCGSWSVVKFFVDQTIESENEIKYSNSLGLKDKE